MLARRSIGFDELVRLGRVGIADRDEHVVASVLVDARARVQTGISLDRDERGRSGVRDACVGGRAACTVVVTARGEHHAQAARRHGDGGKSGAEPSKMVASRSQDTNGVAG
jgi:hypothetical protein